jgi:hypothetical protein
MLPADPLGGVTEYCVDDVGPFAVVSQPRRNAPAEIVRGGGLITFETDVLAQPRHRIGDGPALGNVEKPLARRRDRMPAEKAPQPASREGVP